MPDIDLAALAAYFDESEIEWKPVAVSKKTNKALAAAYVTNRAVQQRLDDVVGPARWQNQFREGPAGGVLCGLSIEVAPDKWVTKWDGAENTDIESVKGGLSDSQRRAAVQWGIGRYLYNVPSQWVPVDENGRFREPPRMNPAFLPGAAPKNGRPQQAPADAFIEWLAEHGISTQAADEAARDLFGTTFSDLAPEALNDVARYLKGHADLA